MPNLARAASSIPAAQARLRAHLAGILDVALDCIVTIDHEGRCIDLNPAAERTFGYPRDAVIGRDMTDLIVLPALREDHRQDMRRLLSGEAPRMLGQRVEITAMRADGSEFPAELAITRIATDGPPRYTAHLRDITERRRSENEILALQDQLRSLLAQRTADLTAAQRELRASLAAQRESQTYFEKSFHSSPALMSIANAGDHQLLEVNPAWLRGSGYTREEVLGRTTTEINLWVHEHQRLDFLDRIQRQGLVRDLQADFRARNGRIDTLLINADVLELGGERCVLTVAIDVTERRRREQVQAATFQISRTILAGGDLEMLFAEVHSIVGGLMSAKNFYVALLSPDGRELSFPYFVDEHVPPPTPRPLGNGFTEYVLRTARPQLVPARELEEILRARVPYQPRDRAAAQRLGVPLIVNQRTLGVLALQDYTNAHAYGPEDLRLLNFVAEQTAVAVERRQAEAALARAEKRYRSIFENAVEGLYLTTPDGRFVSANPTLARMLGYDTVAELLTAVNDVGRQVYVQSSRRADFFRLVQERDEVSDFESEVFRRDGSTLWIAESVRVVRNRQGTVDHFEGVAIDITARRDAARALQVAKEAAEGPAALAQAEGFLPDLVLMDLRLPGEFDGIEAIRRLRRTPRGSALRIVAVSASAYDLDRAACIAAGGDDFLAKPFREEELWAMIQRALGLAWQHAEAEETRVPFAAAVHPPPAAEATAIYELAAKGDVVAIRQRAQALLDLDPKYAPFARNVLDLAGRFKMKAIRQFVARYTG